MTEAQLHRAVAAFLRLALPSTATFTTFPAGGGGKVRGGQLKASGLRAGWPDIQVLWRSGDDQRSYFIGLELKTPKGRLSPEQIACHFDINAAGGFVFVCHSVDEVDAALSAMGIPLKATTFGLGTRIAA